MGDINSYVILPEHAGDELVLVDTGVRSDDAWAALSEGLGALGYRIEEIARVLLTHAHPDHFGQAAGIARAAGCPVWGHRKSPAGIARYAEETPRDRQEATAAFWLRLGVPAERARQSYGPPGGSSIVESVALDRLLEDGDKLTASGLELDVIHVPGHCPDLVVYWHADSGTLFSGDHLLPDITPVCLLDVPEKPDGERTHTLVQFHESIDKVDPLPIELVLPSHGDPLTDHRRLIAFYRLHTQERSLKIARRLQRQESYTPFEIGRVLFPKAWEAQLHLVLSEVMGHLDLLERDGHVATDLRDGILHYRFVSLPEVA